MDKERLTQIMRRFGERKIAVVGDFCLDAYWHADMTRSELSRETPRFPLPIIEERYSPGGASNVTWNLKDLGVGEVYAISVLGEDWRQYQLGALLCQIRVNIELLISSPNRVTPAYIKPIREGYECQQEDSRLDFENHSPMGEDLEKKVIANLRDCVPQVDAVIVADQLRYGTITANVRATLTELAQEYPHKIFTVDSRYRIEKYKGMILKPNELELMKALGIPIGPKEINLEVVQKYIPELSKICGKPVYVTVGEEGVVLFDQGNSKHIPTITIEEPIDTVGAGDTFIAAITAALCSNASFEEAGLIGNIATSVTIKKLNQTGTASQEEILAQAGRFNID